jgi:hypothetical protein
VSDQYEKDLALGAAAEAFLSSDLGRRVTELAGQEIDRCLSALKLVDPSNSDEIRKLQATIARNETLGAWLSEILHLGVEAKNMLNEEEQ